MRLDQGEMEELLVAASQVDEKGEGYAILRDAGGTALALYLETGEEPPLARHADWWLGPLLLVAVLLMVVGAYTLARGAVRLLF